MNHSIVESVSFGPFCLFPRARVLRKSGEPVALGSRALDILIALVERAGEVVNQRELIARAWRGLVVESGNLRVQMTYLRRCLGDGEHGARYIANVPGQGYSFVAPVRRPFSNQQHRRSAEICSRKRRIIRERETATTMIE
jgi:DNA-binding winged helix-turn-helix (wHTH) protein